MKNTSYDEMFLLEDDHWWFSGRRDIINRVLNKFITTEQLIYEIGCGTGGNLSLLSRFGTLKGIEKSPAAIHHAKSRGVCEIIEGELPNKLPIKDNPSLICLLDVLEHIEDDKASLLKLHSTLGENGLLLITVPAYQFLWSDHDVACSHIRRYTLGQLSHLLTSTKFNILYSTYFNTILLAPIAIMRSISRRRKHNQTTDLNRHRILDPLWRRTLAIESKLIPSIRLPFGLSILILAQRAQTSHET